MLPILRFFHETAQQGSIRRASEALNVSPSSVSRQILLLEGMFGTSLFERSSNGVELTHAGRLVHDYVRTVLLDYETLRDDVDDLRGMRRAVIRIAAIESMATGDSLTALQSFRERFPDVRFRMLVLTASAVLDAVRTGTCDIGLTLGRPCDPDLQVLCEMSEPLLLAVSPSHHLASRSQVRIIDLLDESLALHESDHGLRRLIDQACRDHGITLSPALSSSSLHTLREFARHGYGGAIITRRGAGDAAETGDLVLIPIEEPVLDAGKIALVVRRARRLSRPLRLFIEALTARLAGQPGAHVRA